MRTSIFAFVAAVLAFAMSATSTFAAAAAAQCELAAQIIRQEGHAVVNKAWAFEDARDSEQVNLSRYDFLDPRSWSNHRSPPRALIAELLREPIASLTAACPEVPGLIKSLGGSIIDPNDSATYVGADLKSNGPEVLSVSLPVLDREGTDALVVVSRSCGFTCGAGFLCWLRRDADGQWRAVGSRGLWIS
jgi:hypothetical protein